MLHTATLLTLHFSCQVNPRDLLCHVSSLRMSEGRVSRTNDTQYCSSFGPIRKPPAVEAFVHKLYHHWPMGITCYLRISRLLTTSQTATSRRSSNPISLYFRNVQNLPKTRCNDRFVTSAQSACVTATIGSTAQAFSVISMCIDVSRPC